MLTWRIHCSELAKLHKQFVFGGILTEAEFWATRKVCISQWSLLTWEQYSHILSRISNLAYLYSLFSVTLSGFVNTTTLLVVNELLLYKTLDAHKLFTFIISLQKLLHGDNNRSSHQRVGFKSAMISDIKPLADGRVQHYLSLSLSLYPSSVSIPVCLPVVFWGRAMYILNCCLIPVWLTIKTTYTLPVMAEAYRLRFILSQDKRC